MADDDNNNNNNMANPNKAALHLAALKTKGKIASYRGSEYILNEILECKS